MALPPPPLNLQPLGLLGFFQIKNGGEYPQELVPRLQPSLELMDWYAQTNSFEYALAGTQLLVSQSAVGTTWASTTPAGQPLFPPNGECWYVTHYDVRWLFGIGAGATIVQPTLMVAKGSGGASRWIPAQNGSGALTSDAAIVKGGCVHASAPFFLKPGDSPGFIQQGFTTGGTVVDFIGFLRYVRLPM